MLMHESQLGDLCSAQVCRVCEWNSLRASRSAVGGTLAGRRRVALGRNPPVLPRAAGFAGKAAEGPRRA